MARATEISRELLSLVRDVFPLAGKALRLVETSARTRCGVR
jgi:hypothetical protein